MPLRSLLRRELQSCAKELSEQEANLARLPKGSLVRIVSHGRAYYYVVYRDKDKTRLVYKGKDPQDDIRLFDGVKKKRVLLRKTITKLKRRIKFLEVILRRTLDHEKRQ